MQKEKPRTPSKLHIFLRVIVELKEFIVLFNVRVGLRQEVSFHMPNMLRGWRDRVFTCFLRYTGHKTGMNPGRTKQKGRRVSQKITPSSQDVYISVISDSFLIYPYIHFG